MVPPSAVESTLQETWLGVFRGLPRLRSSDRFAPWAYSIARRQAVSRLRREYADAAVRLDDAPFPSTDQPPAAFENAEAVHAGLARLSVAHREILTLYFLNDLSLGETAAVLEIPDGTAKSRLSRARAALAAVLSPEDDR